MEWGVWYSKLKAAGKAKDKHPPSLYDDLIIVWDAFIALSSSRAGAIRFTEIESYLNLNGVYNLEQRQEIAHLVRIMDEKYFLFMHEKYSTENKRKR